MPVRRKPAIGRDDDGLASQLNCGSRSAMCRWMLRGLKLNAFHISTLFRGQHSAHDLPESDVDLDCLCVYRDSDGKPTVASGEPRTIRSRSQPQAHSFGNAHRERGGMNCLLRNFCASILIPLKRFNFCNEASVSCAAESLPTVRASGC